MKFRILKKGEYYIPQCRVCFIWVYFSEGYADSTVMRKSLADAENYIKEQVERNAKLKERPIVIKEYIYDTH